ncbi:MAG: Gfo/Idh/MocA family oxidoreductase [Planctomycetales bacterium]|nr:Gfo/Idh/MocA family oxidoreductase [Planctomycetales bacterium]
MKKKLNWGIIGCGGIAAKFAQDLAQSRTGRLAAVGSRSKAKAQTFAAHHGGACAHGSYEALAADPAVDVVYVATPHSYHLENALTAIDAGKHVLCEKPIALNARQLGRMIDAARKKGVFLMEGMWSRCFPATLQLRQWLARNRIGRILAMEADFGEFFAAGPKHRINNPALGGGALLDLGIYPVSFASMVFGAQPEQIVSSVHKTRTGVDDHAVMVLEYADGATAALSCSCRVAMKPQARLFGTKGMITVDARFYRPNRLTLALEGQKAVVADFAYPGFGLHYEADHVAECIRKGRTESDLMPLGESLAIMQTMDRIRRQWKLKYPGE